MRAGAIAGKRIRALTGEGAPGVVVLVARPEGVRAARVAGLADIAARGSGLARHGVRRTGDAIHR